MTLPPAELNDIPKQYVVETVTSLAELHNMGRVKTDDEAEERIKMYFDICGKLGIRPGIETLSLSLGVTRQTLHRWTRGEDCSPRRRELIEGARQYIAGFLEQCLLSGKGSTVGCIFAAKNWLGYKDATTIEDLRSPTRYANLSPEQIAEQIEKDIPIDADPEEATIVGF